MGPVWQMVRKDLLRRRRSPLGLVLLTAFPLLLSLIIGLTFGSQASGMPKVRLLVEDRDDSLLGGFLLSALGSDEAAKYFEVTQVAEGEGAPLMERGKASALLILPKDFTYDVVAGNETTLQLVRNPAEGILPEVAEQLTATLTDFLSSASRVLRGPLDGIVPLFEEETAPQDEIVADLAVSFNQVMTRVGEYVFPPAITMETIDLEDPDEPEDEDAPTGFAAVFLFILPGMSVYALFLIGDAGMRDLLAEGPPGTLRRQLAGPVGAGTIVAGKALTTALISAGSLLILSAIGLFFTGGRVSLLAFLLLAASLILSVTGAASIFYGMARNERQGGTIANVVYLVMAFVGGTFIEVQALPAIAQRIAPFTPFYWATDGFQTLIRLRGDVADILTNVGILAAIGLVTLPIGARLLHGRVLRGATS
jgi:ABC-2 type transport system permease protein